MFTRWESLGADGLSWRDAAALGGALAAIFALYASALLADYLYADETGYFRLRDFDVLWDIRLWAERTGRPVTGLIMSMFDRAFFAGEWGVRALRMIAMVISLLGATGCYLVLRRLGIRPFAAGLLIVFLWSQPAIAVHHAYLALAPYWVGVFAAMGSFWVFHQRRASPLGLSEGAAHIGLFALGLMTFQATPFIMLPFLAYFVLAGAKPGELRRCVIYLALMLLAIAAYTAAFKALSTGEGFGRYYRAKDLMSLDGLGFFFGAGYLKVFEFWNYPISIRLSAFEKTAALIVVIAAFMALVGRAAWREARREPLRLRRWALALILLGVSFLPIAADGGDERQHMAVAAVMTWILIAVYALGVLWPSEPPLTAARYAAAAVLTCIVAFGAAIGFERNLIRPNAAYLAEIKALIQSGASPELRVVFVAPPDEDARTCFWEPCSGFYGRRVPEKSHVQQVRFYKFAAYNVGIWPPPEVHIIASAEDAAIGPGAVLVDWRVFTAWAPQDPPR